MYLIHCCPSSLQEDYTEYSPNALRQLFNGKKVSSFLDFAVEDEDDLSAISKRSVMMF